MMLLPLVRFEGCRTEQESGTLNSWRIVHGPDPIKEDATSLSSSPGIRKRYSGDFRNASGSSDTSGKMGSLHLSWELLCLMASSVARRMASERASVSARV